MTRKLRTLLILSDSYQSSSHALCEVMAALEGWSLPVGHVETPDVPRTTLEESEVRAPVPLLAQRLNSTYPDSSQFTRQGRYDNRWRSDTAYTARLRTLALTLNDILINAADKESLIPAFAVIAAEIDAAGRQGENRKTSLRVNGRLTHVEGGGRALRWREIAQDRTRENRNRPLLEFLQPAFTAAYFARNRFDENSTADALSLFAPSMLEYRPSPGSQHPLPDSQYPLTGPGAISPVGPQPSALPGSPSAPAIESPRSWQASPQDEAESRQQSGGGRPRLRRHSAQPEPVYERQDEDCAASPPPAGEPAASEPSGTDVRAMRTYRALIRQTREEDHAELETLGEQIRAARAALGISRKQLVTLLHLDLELLVALEHGCGDVATARLVLEQVTAVVEKRRRAASVQ